ncbi:energy-coupling factor ABC transporter ATP-binding protein [Ferroglobus sp.]|uniref:energy-coupling factor ABC transporter ATP-binding protein n=1 Tax=Ferroglobus sp. TaxID=2614230 RepID=UPI0025C1931E|nr:ABC transporter ATP-binding protein [Ferroglobus sp.]
MVDDTVIEAENISYTYPDGTLGFDELSVKIREGERIAIIGANGSGKSTLLLVLSGLLKPTTGKVRILGVNPEENIEEVRKNVGFLFQDPDIFLFNSTVFDELRYVPSQLGWSEEKIKEEVSKIAEEFKISGILKKPPFRLSGGEKKRVALASILIYSPKILFLDEPFANVDAKTKRKIFEILETYDGTVVFTSHELELVESLADRIIVMSLEKRVIAETDKLNEEILRKADLL